ncbi:MAG: PepSY-associated TM helix domain-containing protein, partial [Pseudomonadota bacterium]
YAPFMEKHDFGMVRTEKSPRLKWLDLHNLLGITTMVWVAAVALTGVVNTLETPLNTRWRDPALVALQEEHKGYPSPKDCASLDAAIEEARKVAPGMALQFVAFPGSDFSTDGHFAVFLHGETPLTKHLTKPVLVDARSGAVSGLRDMPWYSKTLSLSRPLHFGDYGGLPLKVIWAVFNALTLIILGSGIYLWVKRRRWTP